MVDACVIVIYDSLTLLHPVLPQAQALKPGIAQRKPPSQGGFFVRHPQPLQSKRIAAGSSRAGLCNQSLIAFLRTRSPRPMRL